MPKKRLIFTLLYKEKRFHLSRNFRLQKVGDVRWLEKNYNFESISQSIDELMIINMDENDERSTFFESARQVTNKCFMPLTMGGRIQRLKDADEYIGEGADKIIVGSAIMEHKKVIESISQKYGSQSIVCSIDYKIEEGEIIMYRKRGKERINTSIETRLAQLNDGSIGEIYLNSIDRDGTGNGYDLETAKKVLKNVKVPTIVGGGGGNQKHLEDALRCKNIDAVATGNLFNFVGDGLPKARKYLIEKEIDIAIW